MSTKVITGKVRFSYANVFKPHSMSGEEQDAKYSVSLIIPKSDKSTLKKIEDAVKSAIEEGKTKWGDKSIKNLKLPLRDGDEDKSEDEVYENSFFLTANSIRKPGVVDSNLDPIIDGDEFYSGCYGRASITFYPFNTNGNKGVAVGLNNLQKLEDGERLSGGSTPEEDFGDDLN